MNENMEMNKVVDEVVETAKDLAVNNDLDIDVAEIAKTVYNKGLRNGVAATLGAAGLGAGLYYGGKFAVGKIKDYVSNRKKSATVVETELVEEAHEEAK